MCESLPGCRCRSFSLFRVSENGLFSAEVRLAGENAAFLSECIFLIISGLAFVVCKISVPKAPKSPALCPRNPWQKRRIGVPRSEEGCGLSDGKAWLVGVIRLSRHRFWQKGKIFTLFCVPAEDVFCKYLSCRKPCSCEQGGKQNVIASICAST